MTPAPHIDDASLRATAEAWLAAEPDVDMREELGALLHGSVDELRERFTGRLQFGTAGLRAAVGVGPQRMNRLVVQQAAAGLVEYLLATCPTSPSAASSSASTCAARATRSRSTPRGSVPLGV
jgi:hypothetical protein